MVKAKKSAEEILNYQKAGVKDRLENAQLYPVDFEPEIVVEFVRTHQPWAPGGLACLYHGMVHEFGRSRVEKAIKSG